MDIHLVIGDMARSDMDREDHMHMADMDCAYMDFEDHLHHNDIGLADMGHADVGMPSPEGCRSQKV